MSTLLVTLMLSGAPAGESTWLGLLAASGKDEQGPCARVVAVAPSGPAATKLTTADCIHSVDGVPVLDSDSFAAAVKGKARDQVVALGLAHRLVEVRLAAPPVNAFEVLCEARRRGPPHVRVAFRGKNIEVDFQGRPTIADARKAVGASPSARAMINPRVQCDETASPVMVDARETTVLENNDWVIFLVETRDAGVPGDSKAP